MRKKLNYILAIAIATTTILSACSEDKLSPIDELTNTIYDPSQGETGSTESMINAFYEKYGSKILYNFKPHDLYFGWSSLTPKWYVPAEPGENDKYIKRMITFLDEKALSEYPTSFVKKFLPYRIFMIDSICDSKDKGNSTSSFLDVLELKTHGVAIAHVSKDMDKIDDSGWDKIKIGVIDALMGSIYSTVGVEPTEFNNTNDCPFMMWAPEDSGETDFDPLGEFGDAEFLFYSNTVVTGTVLSYDEGVTVTACLAPNSKSDFGGFVSFIMRNTKTKQDRVYERFPIIKKRAALVYRFMYELAETDLIEYQSGLCPTDPLPDNYFAE